MAEGEGEKLKVLAVTGRLGSGKSTVSRILATMGARVLDADTIARRLLEQETEAQAEVVVLIGKEILKEDGEIDRKRLAEIVFADRERLDGLNAIIHPRVVEEMRERIHQIDESGEGVELIVLDVPILFGSGVEELVDEVVAVVADEAVRMERAKGLGYTAEEFAARSAAQPSDGELTGKADFVIENDGSLVELKERVCEMLRALREDAIG